MDQQFAYLLSAIPAKANLAVESISADLHDANVKTQSFGWALIAGGTKDTLSDFIGNNRVLGDILTMPDVVYSYGYNFGYGFGFAGPYMLPSYLSDANLSCSGRDFSAVVSKFGLQHPGLPSHITLSHLTNFGLEAKLALHCVIQHSGDFPEAAEVDYLIDDLVEAGVQRLALQAVV